MLVFQMSVVCVLHMGLALFESDPEMRDPESFGLMGAELFVLLLYLFDAVSQYLWTSKFKGSLSMKAHVKACLLVRGWVYVCMSR